MLATAQTELNVNLEVAIQYCVFCGKRIVSESCSCGALFRHDHTPLLWLTHSVGLGYQCFRQIRPDTDAGDSKADPWIYEFRFGRNVREWTRYVLRRKESKLAGGL
ncbi:hypothetical protein HQ520_14670 [bacterium]|nr:hypothetical protein [bacterium]